MMLLLLRCQTQVQKAVVLPSRREDGSMIQMCKVIAHGSHPTVTGGLRLTGKAKGVVECAVRDL